MIKGDGIGGLFYVGGQKSYSEVVIFNLGSIMIRKNHPWEDSEEESSG